MDAVPAIIVDDAQLINVISCPISEIVDVLANGAGNEGQARRIDNDDFKVR